MFNWANSWTTEVCDDIMHFSTVADYSMVMDAELGASSAKYLVGMTGIYGHVSVMQIRTNFVRELNLKTAR